MWEAIQSNRRKSMVLISLMAVLLIGLGFAIGMFVDPRAGGPVGAGVALILWLIMLTVALFQGENVLLMGAKAQRIEKEDAPRLWNIVEEMTIASGLGQMPRVYVIDDDVPNAFAAGRKSEAAVVAVTSGLLNRLNRDELQGVVAHEIGHIRNLDIRFMTIASVMVGSIVIISDVFLRSLWFGAGRRRSSSRGGGQAQLVMLVVAIAVAILAPIFAQMLYFACSRRREFLADASAARFTRYPAGLASALERISKRAGSAKKVNRALAPLYIVNPLQGRSLAGLFATHPPTDVRISILRGMGSAADFAAYETAYRKTQGETSRCLSDRVIKSEESVTARQPSAEPRGRKDAVERAREVADLLDRFAEFLIFPCTCGVRIKVPPGVKRDTLSCPRCGKKHTIPTARPASAKGQPATAPMRYVRQGNGWESFKCSCGKTIQLSPSFSAPSVHCPACQNQIMISTN
jgi:heat shock protein HtpX